MIIAVTYQDGQVFQHFGHTEQFKFYDVENGLVVKEQLADTSGSGHGALAGFLKAAKVDVLLCGGIGAGAKTALVQAGIHSFFFPFTLFWSCLGRGPGGTRLAVLPPLFRREEGRNWEHYTIFL